MLKIDWNDKSIPDWAKYAAIDPDGTVCFFAAKPKFTASHGWHEGTARQFYTRIKAKESLETRPKEDVK